MMTTISMLDSPCDRCGKVIHELRPYKLTDSIVYRGRVVELPWLCAKWFLVEKRKWWKAQASK